MLRPAQVGLSPEPTWPPEVVAVTGGIGSGKSTVSRIFAELGAARVDADHLAREAVSSGSEGLEELVSEFGPGILDGNGGLHRSRLAELVFADQRARTRLEQIVHPVVARASARQIDEALAAGFPLVVYDIPLLFEVGREREFRSVVVVYAPETVRLERLSRQGMPQEQARARMGAQLPLEEKAKRSQLVVDNGGSPEETRAQVEELWERLRRPVGR